MDDSQLAEPPKVVLSTQDWTLKELMDTERRIEKAFHDQTLYLSKTLNDGLNTQTRWMIGLMVTMTLAIIIAVLFR